MLGVGWLGFGCDDGQKAQPATAPAAAVIPAAAVAPASAVVPATSTSAQATAPASEAAVPEFPPAPAPADPAGPLFDPARHMRVAEVRPGMRGYGLSVFRGTRLERFDVEVLSVLRNFNPQRDVVLITCGGAYLGHTGSIAGMSGSPIFLRDAAGRDRMIGAFAYGWPLAKDPIAGVQPIEYMLDLPTGPTAAAATTRPATVPGTRPTATVGTAAAEPAAGPRATWSWTDARAQSRALFAPSSVPALAGPGVLAGGGFGGSVLQDLRPLATPLMVGGLSPSATTAVAAAFGRYGLAPLQSGTPASAPRPPAPSTGTPPPATRPAASLPTSTSPASNSPSARPPVARFVPGGVLAVPLMVGDSDLTAIGTVTEVIGDRVFGFGHPFNNEGRVELPMGPGEIHGVVANLSTSFKLGSMSAAAGTLTADASVGIAGTAGPAPGMAPIDVTVVDADAGTTRDYHFRAVVHPKFTALLAGMALSAAAGGASELPQYNTTEWAVDLEFANGRTIRLADRAVGADLAHLAQVPAVPLVAAADNPFERVPLRRVTATVTVSRAVRDGTILRVGLPRTTYKPGETVRAFVAYKPFRGDEAVLPVEMDLPRDLPAGAYRFVVGDADRYLQDELANRPFRFTAQRVGEVFDVLQEAAGPRHDAVYLRLVRQADGVAVGRTALPKLPSGHRQVLLEAGRSDTTAFVSSAVKVVPVDRVMDGAAEFQITIESPGRAGTPGGRGPASRPAAPVKADELPVPKVGGVDAPPATRP
jgi:hypothetical protein